MSFQKNKFIILKNLVGNHLSNKIIISNCSIKNKNAKFACCVKLIFFCLNFEFPRGFYHMNLGFTLKWSRFYEKWVYCKVFDCILKMIKMTSLKKKLVLSFQFIELHETFVFICCWKIFSLKT